MKLLSFAAILATQVFGSDSLFLSEGIWDLKEDNFEEMVVSDDENVWMITFYADWCPYCETFETEFRNAVVDPKLADKKIKFGAIDVMANRDLTAKYGVTRSPTVKVFGLDKSEPVEYLGQRKQADVVTYCDDYCVENDYVVPPPPIVYEYNIDAIRQSISAENRQRVLEANDSTQTELTRIETLFLSDQQSIVDEFDAKL